MKTVFNEKSTGHITKNYPLFFGEQMGPYDTRNLTYPKLVTLYDQQVGQIWYSTEVSVMQDRVDAKDCPPDILDFMIKNIMWQTATDTIAAKSISGLFDRYISNPELKSMLIAWGFFEDIHEKSYSDIIENVFNDPDNIISDILNNPNIIARSRKIIDIFDEFYNMDQDTPIEVKRKNLIKVFTNIYAMESISFMASFVITFTIAHMGYFAGIGSRVRQIARDEQVHQHMAFEILRIIRDVEKYPEWEETKEYQKDIIDSIYQQEVDWVEYLFDGREAPGLTKDFMINVINFFATPVYYKLGLEAPFELVWDNPVQHLDSFFDTSLIQVAPQELEQTSYLVGAIEDDMGTDYTLDLGDL